MYLKLILPSLQYQEKVLKKRMLEMLPKRESNRLARKKAEMDEQVRGLSNLRTIRVETLMCT